jgi:DNA (cytosine-5)-methyltransferase 1/DNA (cytosine-5)-methyltransferase 3A
MNVLSLFNGMSFGMMALESLNIKVDNYYSSEIDKYANQATQAMFPNTIQVGDILNWREWDIDWGSINLVTGGFPCQAWSMAGKQLGDKDERGMLFWTMLDIMKHVKYLNPKANFLIENVKMKKEFEQYITTHTENALGKVFKVLINSALVSAQNRNRYYWTSFEVEQPEDKRVTWGDVREYGVEGFYYTEKGLAWISRHSQRKNKKLRVWGNGEKAQMVEASHYKNYSAQRFFGILDWAGLRYITPLECFRLQTVPDHHIDTLLNAGISNTQLYKMCGNGWTHDVITHIFKGLI